MECTPRWKRGFWRGLKKEARDAGFEVGWRRRLWVQSVLRALMSDACMTCERVREKSRKGGIFRAYLAEFRARGGRRSQHETPRSSKDKGGFGQARSREEDHQGQGSLSYFFPKLKSKMINTIKLNAK